MLFLSIFLFCYCFYFRAFPQCSSLFFIYVGIFVQIITNSIIYVYMDIGKTNSFLCFLFFLFPTPVFIFLFSSKLFLFYHLTPQRLLVSVMIHGFDLLFHNFLEAFSVDSEIARMTFLFFFLQSYLVDSKYCIKIFL